MKTKKLEDITSKEFLDKSLENAKFWCQLNLPKYFEFEDEFNYPNATYNYNNYKFDYSIFRYIIDNEMIGSDMRLDENQQGLVRVSTRKLKWHQKREEYFRKYDKLYGKIREPVEVDPESIFIHEITEFIVCKNPILLLPYFSQRQFPNSIARQIENINRRERGLREWLEY